MIVPVGVTYTLYRALGEPVDERAVRRKGDVVDVEFLQGVLQVVPPRLAPPVVAKSHAQRLHPVYFGKHVELEGAVLAAGNRHDAVVIVAGLCFSIIQDGAEIFFPLEPVDMNLLLGRLASAADAHFVEYHPLEGLGDAAARAVLHMREKWGAGM